jgi:nucleoside triphosphate pyrophosphatase
VLASNSPQRRAILEQLGVRFEVIEPHVEELDHGPPEQIAAENASRKAEQIAGQVLGSVVLGVDTVVWLEGTLYGKPANAEVARHTLRALSGKRHLVISGICLVEDGSVRRGLATTAVRFRALDEQLIEWYVRGEEWRGRAGGYAIQGRGAALVAAIEGDYLNVVGLPVTALLELAPWVLETAD